MLKRRFEWKDDTELGAGWVPAWNEHLDFPTTGFGAAHDVLEHFPKLGGMQGEMMAFGAMHFVRSDDWKFRNSRDIYEAQKNDIARELTDFTWAGKHLPVCSATRKGSDYIDTEKLRAMIRESITSALHDMASGADENYAYFRRMMPRDIAQRIERWIIKGAIAAEKRYAKLGVPHGCQMTDLFGQVLEKFDQVAKHNGEEGEYVDVRVDFNERAVTVVRDYHYA